MAPLNLTNISFLFLKITPLVIFNVTWHVRVYAAKAKA